MSETNITDLPIIDWINDDPQSDRYIMIFVPSNEISKNSKETSIILKSSSSGRTINEWLLRFATFLRLSSINCISHAGGYNFTFHARDGQVFALTDISENVPMSFYDGLKYLGLVAENAFLIDRLMIIHGINCNCSDSCLEYFCDCGFSQSTNRKIENCPDCGQELKIDGNVK